MRAIYMLFPLVFGLYSGSGYHFEPPIFSSWRSSQVVPSLSQWCSRSFEYLLTSHPPVV
jgi:hypothetical protein